MIEAMNIPKLRFPEFQDIWASDNLISLSKVKMSNGVFNDPKKVGSGYRLINVKDMYIDRKIDIDAGIKAGCKTIFVNNNYYEKKPTKQKKNVKSLHDAVKYILKKD